VVLAGWFRRVDRFWTICRWRSDLKNGDLSSAAFQKSIDLFPLASIFGSDERDGFSRLTRASGAADSVDVIFRDLGEIVVDNVTS
jgi:hypothetical protein